MDLREFMARKGRLDRLPLVLPESLEMMDHLEFLETQGN